MPEEIPPNEAEEVDEAPSVKKGKKSRRKKQAHNNESEQPAGEREYETVSENGKKQESAQNPPPAVNQVLQTSITQPPPSVPESGQSKSGNADVSSNGAAANPTQRTDSTMSGSDTVEKAGMEKLLRGIFVEPIVAVGSVAKDAGETALKPVKQVVRLGEIAAVKVRDDVELLVRDPKEFAKRKKEEVEDMVFPEVEDEDDDVRKEFLTKQKTVHLKDYTTTQFSLVVLRSAWLNAAGGFVNALSLAGIWKLGMTHLTGTTTFAATRAVNPPNALMSPPASLGTEWFLAMMACFGAGGMVGGIIIGDNRYRWRGRQALTLTFEAVMLAVSYACVRLSQHTYCDGTGAAHFCDYQEDYNLKYLGSLFISLASGAHTTSTTLYTGLTIRSCHVTGTVTDIGLAIGQMIHTRSFKYMWKLQVWIPCMVGFLVGAVCGTIAFNAFAEQAILIAIGLILAIVIATVLDTGYKALRQKDRVILGVAIRAKKKRRTDPETPTTPGP